MPKSIREWFWKVHALPFPNFYAKHACQRRWGQFATSEFNRNAKPNAKTQAKAKTRKPLWNKGFIGGKKKFG